MTRIFESKKLCATMMLLFAISVAANRFAGGPMPSFGSEPALVPDTQFEQLADDIFFPPDPDESTSRS